MSFIPWKERPIEMAHLLNPAFCSLLLKETVDGYSQEYGNNMPYIFSFLVLPLILHKQTRDILPRTIRTRFHSWAHQSQSTRLNYIERTRQLVPFTKEALLWCLSSGLIAIDDKACLYPLKNRLNIDYWPSDSEPKTCKDKAFFLGRWLTRAGDPSTILAILGIKP